MLCNHVMWTKIGQRWTKMDKKGLKWSKNGPKWSKTMKHLYYINFIDIEKSNFKAQVSDF